MTMIMSAMFGTDAEREVACLQPLVWDCMKYQRKWNNGWDISLPLSALARVSILVIGKQGHKFSHCKRLIPIWTERHDYITIIEYNRRQHTLDRP